MSLCAFVSVIFLVAVILPEGMGTDSLYKELYSTDTGWIVLHEGTACYLAFQIGTNTGYGENGTSKYFKDIQEISPFVMIGSKDKLPADISQDFLIRNMGVLVRDLTHPNPAVRRFVEQTLREKKIKK